MHAKQGGGEGARTDGLHDVDAERVVAERAQHGGQEGGRQHLVDDRAAQEQRGQVRGVWGVQLGVLRGGSARTCSGACGSPMSATARFGSCAVR